MIGLKQRLTQLLLCFCVLGYATFGQTTEFLYQGRLTSNDLPPTASYDFEFSLWDAIVNGSQIGSAQSVPSVAVANGVFAVSLNIGAGFDGGPRFLQIALRPAGIGTFTTLVPRQPFTSTPYSIRSSSSQRADLLSASCVQCITDSQILSIAGNKLTGVITGNGSGITNISGGSITSGSIMASQLSPEAVPNTTPFKLLGSLRWDLLRPQTNFAVGISPVAAAFDGANIWVANSNGNTVTKLRVSDGANLGTFAVGSFPSAVAFDGANIWVANQNTDNITKLRASDGANLGTFAVGSGPQGIAFDGSNMWVVNNGNDNVVRLFPAFPQP